MWAKIAGKGGKGGRIQPPILLNFSIHLRSQHCALSSAVGLLGHHFFALPLLFIWGQTYLESTFHPGELNAYLVFIQILYCSFSLLQIQISTKLLLCLVIASSLICLDLSCLCSGSIISPFFFLSGICELLTCELYELQFVFPFCHTTVELYKYKTRMWWIV